VSHPMSPWAYLALPALGLAIWLAGRRWLRPDLGSSVRPLVPGVLAAAQMVRHGLRESGHHLAFEYINPEALAAECLRCGGRLVVIGEPGAARVHGSDCLTRACEARP
jgi:hypothetical protein